MAKLVAVLKYVTVSWRRGNSAYCQLLIEWWRCSNFRFLPHVTSMRPYIYANFLPERASNDDSQRVKNMCVVFSLLLFCQMGNWWLFNWSWFCCRHPRRSFVPVARSRRFGTLWEAGEVAPQRMKFRLIDSRRAIFALSRRRLTVDCHMFGVFNRVTSFRWHLPHRAARYEAKEKIQFDQVALRACFLPLQGLPQSAWMVQISPTKATADLIRNFHLLVLVNLFSIDGSSMKGYYFFKARIVIMNWNWFRFWIATREWERRSRCESPLTRLPRTGCRWARLKLNFTFN